VVTVAAGGASTRLVQSIPRACVTGLLLTLSGPSTAQVPFQLSGRVYAVVDGDTVPLVDHWVTLHMVSMTGGSMLDSGRTDQLGIYVLRTAQQDVNALYLSSVQYRDVTYFSTPVRAAGMSADTVAPLMVYDTSSVAPQIAVTQRHVVVRQRNENGERPVLELIVLENPGQFTRIAGNSTQPVWQHTLPTGAFALQMGESDVSADAFQRFGDTLSLLAPIPPGQKQLVFSYTIPGERRLELPVDHAADRFLVLLEDTSSSVTGPIDRVGTEQMEGLRFARYDAAPVAAGLPVVIDFTGQPLDLADFWWVIVATTLLIFAAVTITWWRRVERIPATSDDPDVLAARIALLDENFAREREHMSDGDRTAYENTRAELKARLNTALARRNYQR